MTDQRTARPLRTLGALGSVLFVCSIVTIIVQSLIVPTFLHQTEWSELARDLIVFDVYDYVEEAGEHPVFFIGSSQIGEGVDAGIFANASSGEPAAYNLGVSGDTPYRRLLELERIVTVNPSLVVIGLTYFQLSEPENQEVRFELAGLIDPPLSPETMDLLRPGDRAAFDSPMWEEQVILRRSLGPALEWNFRHLIGLGREATRYSVGSEDWITEVHDPHTLHDIERDSEDFQGAWEKIEDVFEIVSIPNLNTLAFEETLDILTGAAIPIVVISMPLNPIITEFISAGSQVLFSNYLANLTQSRNLTFLDHRTLYGSEMFSGDITHLNKAGRLDFSTRLASELAQFLEAP